MPRRSQAEALADPQAAEVQAVRALMARFWGREQQMDGGLLPEIATRLRELGLGKPALRMLRVALPTPPPGSSIAGRVERLRAVLDGLLEEAP